MQVTTLVAENTLTNIHIYYRNRREDGASSISYE